MKISNGIARITLAVLALSAAVAIVIGVAWLIFWTGRTWRVGPPMVSLAMDINGEVHSDLSVTVAPGAVLKPIVTVRPGRDPSPTYAIALQRNVQIGASDEPRFITLAPNQPYTLKTLGTYTLKVRATDKDGQVAMAFAEINVSNSDAQPREATAVVEQSNIVPSDRNITNIDVTILLQSRSGFDRLGKPAPVLLLLDEKGLMFGEQVYASAIEYLEGQNMWQLRFNHSFKEPLRDGPVRFLVNLFAEGNAGRIVLTARTSGVVVDPDALEALRSGQSK